MKEITQAQFNSMVDNDIIDKSQENYIKFTFKLKDSIEETINECKRNAGGMEYGMALEALWEKANNG